jgi:hypothetical protein
MEGSTQDKAQIEGPQVLYTRAKTTEKVAAANTFPAKSRAEVVVQHVCNLYNICTVLVVKTGVRTQDGRKGKILPRHSSLAGTKYIYT